MVYSPSQFVNLSLGYLARNVNNPTEGNGLFNGTYAALAQLEINPSNNLSLGITYVRAFYPKEKLFVSAVTGSQLANAPFGRLTPTSADHLGFQTSWQVSPKATISGWTGLSFATAEDNVGPVNKGDKATVFNWAITLGFPDLVTEGSLLGFVIGNPPKVINNDGGLEDKDTAWHLEGFYRFQVNDNIAINPGVLAIVNPEHDGDNDTILVVLLRTIFKF